MPKHETGQIDAVVAAQEQAATDSVAQNGTGPVQDTLPARIPSEETAARFTAAQVETNCPTRLREIGKEIAHRVATARQQASKLVEEHVDALNRLMDEAKGLCDVGGFAKFRELFCPQLGKSQAYNLRAIASGKKTFTQHRTEERDRKRRTRSNKKAAMINSGTVPEKGKLITPYRRGAV